MCVEQELFIVDCVQELFILLEYLGSPNVCGVPVAVYPSGVPGFTQRLWGSCCSILLSVYCYGAMLIVCRDAT